MTDHQKIIENAFNQASTGDKAPPSAELLSTIDEVIEALDTGKYRVANPEKDIWVVHSWIKQAILLFFKYHSNELISAAPSPFFDKVPLKFTDWSEEKFKEHRIRVVPNALARKGSYIAPNVVLMPSYVNIGAYIDSGTLIDTWATVGSCAQIGKNVHLSGGAGIGGVLEPLQAQPTIIEDNCFIGARSEIVEGVIVEKGSVISMGVYIGQSTPIYDREKDEITYGRIPAGSVVIPGSLPSKNGKYSRNAAIIVKQVDEKTRSKTSLNDLLRFADD